MGILAFLRETQEWGMAQRMKFNKAGLLALVLISLTGFTGVTWADEDQDNEALDTAGAKINDFIKSRTYIGGIGISSTIDQWGDFTGVNAFSSLPVTTVSIGGAGSVTNVSNPEVNFIPTINRNYGFGAMVGHREGPWAAEISYWRSDHTANFYYISSSGPATFTTPARLEALNLDFKRYFFTQYPAQPFVSVGFSFPWLWVRQGSSIYDPSFTTVQGSNDETISGIGFNVGAGLEIYIGNGFSLIGGAYETWTSYDQINGASKIPLNTLYWDNNPADISSIGGNGLNLYVGTTITIE